MRVDLVSYKKLIKRIFPDLSLSESETTYINLGFGPAISNSDGGIHLKTQLFNPNSIDGRGSLWSKIAANV